MVIYSVPLLVLLALVLFVTLLLCVHACSAVLAVPPPSASLMRDALDAVVDEMTAEAQADSHQSQVLRLLFPCDQLCILIVLKLQCLDLLTLSLLNHILIVWGYVCIAG